MSLNLSFHLLKKLRYFEYLRQQSMGDICQLTSVLVKYGSRDDCQDLSSQIRPAMMVGLKEIKFLSLG